MFFGGGTTAQLILSRLPRGAPKSLAKSAIEVRLVWTAWLTAGIFACITAMFDRNPGTAIFRHAVPQSFGLSVGILFLPRYAMRSGDAAPFVETGILWILTALAVAVASVLFLEPGFAI